MRPTLNAPPASGGRGSLGLHSAAPAAPVSVWARLDSVPHRAFFLAGVLAALSQGLWWALVWLLAPQQAYAAVPVHGLMTPLAVFPLFMQGFVFTAGPRWLNVADGTPKRGNLLQAVAGADGHLAGVGRFHAGWRLAAARFAADGSAMGGQLLALVKPSAIVARWQTACTAWQYCWPCWVGWLPCWPRAAGWLALTMPGGAQRGTACSGAFCYRCS